MLAAWTTKFAGAQSFNNLVIPVVEEPDEPEVIDENPDTFVDETPDDPEVIEENPETFVDETPEVIDFSNVRVNIRKRKLDLD